MFGRLGILGVVAALVVSLVVLVPPGAAEAVDPGSLDVTDFVVLGVDGVYLKQNASVTSGDVGAVNATSGPYLAGSQETTIGLGVTVPVGSRVFGDSVKLKLGSMVGDVYTNDLSGDGTIAGSVFTPVSFPLNVTLPEIPVAQPGVTNFDVTQGGSLVLDAGSYGLLKARKDATVTLTGGVYHFAEWDIGDRVVVEASAPSQIIVAGRVDMGKNSALTPRTGVEPFEVELTALGENGNTGTVGATPKAAKFGIGSTVSARVRAPNGTVWLRQNAQGRGQFIGRWVTVGIGVTVERSVDEGSQLPPSVELVSPVEGAVVFEIEVVEANVAGGGEIVSVVLRVDGSAVGVLSDLDGDGTYAADWDTRMSGDGTVALEVVAVDTAGTVGVSDSVTVTVGNGSTGAADRIAADYARGLLTADEYATYGLQSLMNAVDLPERYASSFLVGGLEGPVDGTQAVLTFLKDWDQMSAEVQQAVIGLGEVEGPVTGDFTPDEPSGGQPVQQTAAQQATTATASFAWSDFSDCLEKTEAYVIRTVGFPAPVLPKAFECRTVFDHATVYWNVNSGTFWDVVQVFPPIVVPLRKDALVDFSDNENLGDGNGVPDYIDRIGNQMDVAWEVYDDMGYSQPVSLNVYISELDYTDDAPDGFVLPGPLVQFDNDGATTEYLPRHEQFHVAQFDHMLGGLDPSDLLNFYNGTRWWMEATAEWAAHQTMVSTGAPSAQPVADNSDLNYSRRLPALFNSPEGSLVDVDWFLGLDVPSPRSYGSFILAEYLDERLSFAGVDPWLGGADTILRTWDRIGDGATSTTPQRAIEEVIAESTTEDSLASVLEGFGIANYLMDEPTLTGYGYNDPDASGWKANEGLAGARPATESAALTLGSSEVGSSVLGRGGSHYVEFRTIPMGEPGTVDLTPTAVNGVAYTALRVTADSKNGATLCDDGIDPVVSLMPGIATEVPVDSGCDTVTLVATYTDLASNTRTAGWQASFEPAPVSTRLVVQGSQYLWEYDGSVWTQLPALPGVDYGLDDFEVFNGEVFALARTFQPNTKQVFRLSESGSWVLAGETGWPTDSPQHLTATTDNLYLLTELGGGQQRITLSRYDSDLVWTQVANLEGMYADMAAISVGGDSQIVFITEIGPYIPDATRTTIWSWSETYGLQQGVFETATGPESIYDGRLGMGPSTLYGGEFMFTAAADESLSTTDGLTWEFNAEPPGGLSVMEAHDGLVYYSDYSWQESGVQEGGILTWDGATTEVLNDPGPAMAWTSFQSDGETLWMAGFRDLDDYSQDIVEAGVYASTNGIDRVPITTGIMDLEGYIPKMILWQPTP